jgi:hypothetical protein
VLRHRDRYRSRAADALLKLVAGSSAQKFGAAQKLRRGS